MSSNADVLTSLTHLYISKIMNLNYRSKVLDQSFLLFFFKEFIEINTLFSKDVLNWFLKDFYC